MVRNIWIAVCGSLVSASLVLAQPGPSGPSPYGSNGYPGYPTPPYGAPQPPGPMGPGNVPMMPYGYGPSMMPMNPLGPGGMMPYRMPQAPQPPGGMMPYGVRMPQSGDRGGNPFPMPIPPDPRRPVGLPVHDDAGPRQGASEPYLVGPEKNPPVGTGPALTLPPARGAHPTGPIACDPIELASYEPPVPAEPYTLHEGRRYLADVKQDNVCVFGQVSFIHWWTSRDRTTPLLTTGTAANAGTLGNPDTLVLVGGALAPKEFSGVQASFGVWLDPERLTSLEFGGFYVGKNSRQYGVASDANGNNVIAQPAVAVFPPSTTLGEGSFLIAAPGFVAGNASVSSVMSFHGAEVNIGRNVMRMNGLTLDYLIGARYLYLNDTLTTSQNSTLLPAGAGTAFFLGVPQPAGAGFSFNDSFNLTNRFYGGQISARANWVSCYGFDLGAIVKVAFGNTAHTAIIDGTTTLTNAGVSSTASGGAYAQPSNIGQHGSNDFTVIPEVNLTIGYQIHPHIRLTAGYNLLYWPRVERAGEQIERTVDPRQSPTDPTFVPGTIGTFPRFPNVHTDFWAQGINVGVEVKY